MLGLTMGKVAIPAGQQGPAGPKINQPFTPILIAAGNAHCDLCQVWRSFFRHHEFIRPFFKAIKTSSYAIPLLAQEPC
jgi:hypothetical protein